MFEKGRIVVALAVAIGALVPATASAQLAGSSGIAGVVRDTSGAVLPGVTVEASSPALIEKTRTRRHRRPGPLQHRRASARRCTRSPSRCPASAPSGAKASSSGRTSRRRSTPRCASARSRKRSPSRSESPVVDVLRVESRNVISKDALETLPTNKTLPAFVALTPGLVAAATSQDVGGSKGEVFIQPAIHGGRTDGGTHGARRVRDQQPGRQRIGPRLRAESRQHAGDQRRARRRSRRFAEQRRGDQLRAARRRQHVHGHDDRQLQPRQPAGHATSAASWSRAGLNASSIGGLDRIWDTSIGVGGPINRDRVWFFTSLPVIGAARTACRTSSTTPRPTGLFYTKDDGAPGARRLHEPPLQRPRHLAGVAAQQVQCLVGQPVHAAIATAASARRWRRKRPPRGFYRPDIVTATWSFPKTSRLLFEAGSATSRLDYSPTPQDFAAPDGISDHRAIEQPDLSGCSVERR